MAEQRRWLTVRETSLLYSWHPKTVLALCRARKIPFTRLPSARGGRGSIRIDRIELDRELKAREKPAIVEPARIDRRRR